MQNTIEAPAAVTRSGRRGWIVLIILSAPLLLSGIYYFFDLPEMALENIAEPAGLAASDLRQGVPFSAFDVITLITRNYAIAYIALGLMGMLAALDGYRHGTRQAWLETCVVVAAFAAAGLNFIAVTLAAGEGPHPAGLMYLALAAVGLAGLLLVRRGLAT